MIKQVRTIEYTDDGCTAYECLACNARWEGRSKPGPFCSYCGIKFEKHQEENANKAGYKYWIAQHNHDVLKRHLEEDAHWVIEGAATAESPIDGTGITVDSAQHWKKDKWLVLFNEPMMHDLGGCNRNFVLQMFKRYKRQELYLRRTLSDFHVPLDLRVRLVKDSDQLPKALNYGYPYSEEYYERAEREESEDAA